MPGHRQTKKERDELRELAEFFETWFGDNWELKVRLRARLYRYQFPRALSGEERIGPNLLPRLRALRTHLLYHYSCPARAVRGPRRTGVEGVCVLPPDPADSGVHEGSGQGQSVPLPLLQSVPTQADAAVGQSSG
jgi:hypothetical protein